MKKYPGLDKYGIRKYDIFMKILNNPEKSKFIDEGLKITVAEIEYLIESEMVELPLDLLIRRLRVAFQDGKFSESLLPKVVDIWGNLKNLNEEQKKKLYQKNLSIYKKMQFS